MLKSVFIFLSNSADKQM